MATVHPRLIIHRYPRASRRSGVERTPNIPSSVDPPSHVANDSAILSPDTTERDTRATRRYVSPSLSEIAVHQDGANAPGRVVYMGDSANFKYVVHEVGNPFRSSDRYRFWGDNLQRSMLDRLGPPTQVAIQNFRAQDDEQLRRVRAFDTPTKDVGDSLIRSFWTYSYPVFPVFHWEDFMAKYNSGSLSPLLLNAVYMVASFHCPESVIHDAGLSCRYLAGLTFYRRAKALYDADYESDGITTIQATVLLSNWWGGPMELKDTWYWLGVAVGLAQSLGMHRSYVILRDYGRR